MGNYLNPSILTDGIDNLAGRHIGWLLVGKPISSDSVITNGSMPASDAVIAGIMDPVQVKLSSIDENNKLILGNIGYFVSNTDEPTAPSIASKPSLTSSDGIEITNEISATEDITKIAIDGNSIGQISLFVRNTSSQSTILPSGVIAANKEQRYIDIGSGNGKILLALWKENVDYTKESFATELKNKYVDDDTSYIPPSSNNETCNKYIESILFSYDVMASVPRCNDWNYTGFSVGEIEVSLSGLSS